MSVAYVASIEASRESWRAKKWKKGKGEEQSFATNPTSWFICKLTAPDDRDDLAD